MYCKHWCSRQDRMDGKNSHQSLASLDLETPARFCTLGVTRKYKKIPSKKLSNKDWTTGVQCESLSSLTECHFEIRRIGRDCWPWRLKFNMADVSKPAITLDRNIFRVYKLTSHNIFTLMFCNSLEKCKISAGCSCCTGESRNRSFFQFFLRNSGVNIINTTPSITKVGWCETNWCKLPVTQVGRICEHIW